MCSCVREWGSLSDIQPFMAMNFFGRASCSGVSLLSGIGLKACDGTSEDRYSESKSLQLGTKKQLSPGVRKEPRLFC